ncbi:MAG: efflux RND transporter permease subunit [Desulfobacterales bacterium]
MNITLFAIEKNRVTTVFLLIVLFGGIAAYQRSPRDYDPGFIIRAAQVVTYFPGASPERVELLVTDKLEKAIQEIPELDFIKSQSKTGLSIIRVEIQERYAAMRPIWDNLRRKVAAAAVQLPEGVVGPFVNDEFGDVFGIVLGLTGEGFSYPELKAVADQIRDELLRIADVAKVELYGVQEERIFVEFNNARLAQLGLSPYQLMRILESRNIIIPGGDLVVGPERIVLEPSGNFDSVDDLRQTVISIPGRRELLFLEDIVDIRRGTVDPPRTLMHSSGAPSLGLAVSMRAGGNLIELGRAVRATLERLQGRYPHGIEIETLSFQPEEVDHKILNFRDNLLQSMGVVIAVMVVTLGLRTGLLVASLIPMTILMAVGLMYLLRIGLDQVSLAALIISLGMLVDNAIVMTESIMVQMAEGKPRVAAAVDSARELIVPLLTSSLTTAAAFLPIFLAKSSTGEYTAPLFKVVTLTLLSSWVLALTMTPMLCVEFLQVKPLTTRFDSRIYRLYRFFLITSLKHRGLVIAFVALIFAAAITGARFLPVIFFPPSDRVYFKAELTLPAGTAIATTESVVGELEAFIRSRLMAASGDAKGVVSWATHIASGGPRFVLQHQPDPGTPESALMVITTPTPAAIGPVMDALDDYISRNFPDAELKMDRIENGPPIRHPVEFRLSGKDPLVLFEIAEEIKQRLRGLGGTRNIKDDWGQRIKKIVVDINQPRARRAGVTSRDIALSLQTDLSGFELSAYREDDKVIPIVLRSVAADRQDIGRLESLNVYAQTTGRSVPLKQVADITLVWQYGEIVRRNRLKTVTVSADLTPGVTASAITRQIVPWLDAQAPAWPVGYRYELGGEAETSEKANASIRDQVPVAAFIILLLLVTQFNSLRRTLIIMVTIPLGFIGVIIGLFAARLYFGFMTLLGIISLAGIVVNNAIVMLERIRLEHEVNGLAPQQAILEAGQRRLRPILLTTATTVFGLLPLYLWGGEMWAPLTVAIMSGLIFATALSLVVVPVLYALLFRVGFKDYRRE